MTAQPEDFAAVPILMDLLPDEAPAPAGVAGVQALPFVPASSLPAPQAAESLPPAAQIDVPPPRRALRREDQQPLFAELPAAPPRPAAAPKRAKPSPGLQRMAEELLRAKAPAIIDELAEKHARHLSAQLRERLRNEMARILVELADTNPADLPDDGGAPPAPASA